mmetsp:Transcript_129463/g.360616  ORF Transcript_129463/g.360616 Transcript_129463/m.360616 type:complete len:201 (-) Transcript_129463:669-1271(-)
MHARRVAPVPVLRPEQQPAQRPPPQPPRWPSPPRLQAQRSAAAVQPLEPSAGREAWRWRRQFPSNASSSKPHHRSAAPSTHSGWLVLAAAAWLWLGKQPWAAKARPGWRRPRRAWRKALAQHPTQPTLRSRGWTCTLAALRPRSPSMVSSTQAGLWRRRRRGSGSKPCTWQTSWRPASSYRRTRCQRVQPTCTASRSRLS